MKGLSRGAAVAALGAASIVGVAHTQGDWQWIPIADSEADFSGVQGQGGWYYLFAASEEDPGSPMTVFDVACAPNYISTVNPAWRSACGSFCFMTASQTHTNAAQSCSTTAPGVQVAVRRYVAPSTSLFRIEIAFVDDESVGGNQDGVRLTTRVDGRNVWQVESTGQEPIVAASVIDIELSEASPLDLRSHPKSGCHSDSHQVRVKVSALDCNGDGIVDYGQILDGTLADANANGVPDCCDKGVDCDPCVGDVNFDGIVNGADISVLLGFWGLNGKPVAADINKDGQVDGADLAQMLGSWGECR